MTLKTKKKMKDAGLLIFKCNYASTSSCCWCWCVKIRCVYDLMGMVSSGEVISLNQHIYSHHFCSGEILGCWQLCRGVRWWYLFLFSLLFLWRGGSFSPWKFSVVVCLSGLGLLQPCFCQGSIQISPIKLTNLPLSSFSQIKKSNQSPSWSVTTTAWLLDLKAEDKLDFISPV